MQQRLKLPKPVPQATVRDYVGRWKAATAEFDKLMARREKTVEG